MGIGTVYFVPSNIEPFCWLGIFLICAYLIAKKCYKKFFITGFFVSLINSVWITSAHILLFTTYIANHPQEAAMMAKMPIPDSPRLMMLLTGPVVGVISGLVLGLFAFIASKLVKRKNPYR